MKTAGAIRLSRVHESWLWTAAACTSALHVSHVPPWLTVLAGLTLLWRGDTWWRRRPLPPRWLVTFIALAAAASIVLYYRSLFGREPGVALLIVFLTLKLLEMRVMRDGWVVALLCYFLIFSVFFTGQTMAWAAAAMAVTLVVTAALAGLTHEGHGVVGNLRLAAVILGQAVPFMLAMFVLFPRVPGPLWRLPGDAFGATSGLSDTMAPGSISRLTLSDSIAFRAKFDGPVPPQTRLYWRGPVLTQFDGQVWRMGARRRALAQHPPGRAGVAYSITLEPHGRNWLFALELPVSTPPNAALADDYQLLGKDAVNTRLRYDLRSDPALRFGRHETEAVLLANVQLPPGTNPRTRALASRWRRELGDDDAIVQRALAYFRNESFVYTLQPPPVGENGIDEFLFDTRRGFCEHYAGALVFMMRAAGIPARVVTGYQGGETNPLDDYVVIRQADAHAWAEVWLRDSGWTRVDPTAAIAPARIERGIVGAAQGSELLPLFVRADARWLRELRFRWEALSNTWNQWVLGYSPQRQRELLSRLGMHQPDWRSMTAALAAACGLLLLAMLPWAMRQRRRPDPAQAAWRRLSRKMERLGLHRQAWEGPLHYAKRISAAMPHMRDEVDAIAQLYSEARYGGGGDAARVRQLETAIRRLKPTRP